MSIGAVKDGSVPVWKHLFELSVARISLCRSRRIGNGEPWIDEIHQFPVEVPNIYTVYTASSFFFFFVNLNFSLFLGARPVDEHWPVLIV